MIDGGSGMDGWRLVRALARGVAAALLGGVLGAVLTRALMRVIMVVADGTLSFTWSGLAFIALLRRLPSARCGRARLESGRWPLFVFVAGAVAIPVQAAGIA